MSVFNWYHASIKQKIGGLFVLLLSFLFFVIVYSGYKIKLIEKEMREVAYLDIPLSQIMRQVEFIELEQHLQFEQYQLKGEKPYQELKQHQQLVFQQQQLKSLLDRAVGLITESLSAKQLMLAQSEHEQVLSRIESYAQKSAAFESHLEQLFESQTLNDEQRSAMEQMAAELESAENDIIQQLNTITTNDVYYTEKHEKEFLFVSSLLGISAVVLGFLLTVYIVQIILQRIKRIQGDIKTLNASLDQGDSSSQEAVSKITTKDELAELEHDIKAVMSRLAKEITCREQVEKQLLTLATQDKLTGAYNRHKWEEQINMQLNLAQRGSYPFGLILLDVDYFKRVNDQFGHQVGDQLLKRMVSELQQRIRSTDMLFRLGGEEFAILLPMQDIESACKLAESLRSQMELLQVDNLPAFTISVGVTSYHDMDSEASIFRRADMALYRAKAQGRNQVVQQLTEE
ncbi:GGDEF domain-containing protein [Vibrio fluvialis]|uniref:GGDEF domain-containing protein n=1 Tax=Vibrio sp. bablab_jr001 TaxID=2755067 RepID=UPI0018F19232|nr:GGDEF domain-containing protein [Vibrio sp. bablab_jr001]EKO3399589.1 GGDEF domain-containing protein [Vibrio fluvialis]EKO3473556.1 GGDEF domain-containing protein [Vibrio fluvialis]MBY8115999.1 GGDEF domain-containing protein [Vibrio fluvialis]MBY8248783.1 GGDEF domain-containing protein [Vibrio fluvialis]MBY8282761.1 GGDEF domain-containing protein [Vibrio fluvialis]